MSRSPTWRHTGRASGSGPGRSRAPADAAGRVTVSLVATLVGVGFLGAFFSGLLGIGGALVMFPLLLYVPLLVGVGQLDVKAVVGVTMALVFVAAVSGFLAHRRHHAISAQLTRIGGVAGPPGSFVGARASKWVDDTCLLLVF